MRSFHRDMAGFFGALALVLVAAATLGSQAKPADELKAKVAELVKELDAPKAAARQTAQQELIKLGPEALKLLPEPDAQGLSAEQVRRLVAVRAALGKKAGRANLEPGKITLAKKGITLSDAVAEIRKQTGNEIVDLREEFGQEVTNPEFSADWQGKSFWEVMDDLAAKTRVGYYLHTGERHLGLVMQPVRPTPVTYAGPLRIALMQIVRRVSFEDGQKECVLQFEIAWEPRIRPMLFETKADDLEVVDDQGRKIAVEADDKRRQQEGEEGAMKAAVDGSMIRTDFIVRLSQPPKGSEKLSIRGKMTVTLPAEIQSFEFADLAKAKDAKKQKGNVTVVLEKFKELEEGLWGADILLEFDAKGEAFESYETWFYDNEIFLQRADGTRFVQNGGTSLTQSEDGRIGIQYRFVDAPGKIADYKLIYRTPSTIVKDSLPFEFKDVELP